MRKYNPYDLIGQTHKRLTVKEIAVIDNQTYIICECTCGNTIKCFPWQFNAGSYSSCGCLKKETAKAMGSVSRTAHNRIDGRATEPLYGIWKQMISRCENPKSHGYSYYGGKGIKVCTEWHDYLAFKKWALSNGYQIGLSIDRKDFNSHYEPNNCVWIPKKRQSYNKSSNINITYNGKTQTLTEWADELGINRRTMNNRYNRGWSVEKMLTPHLFKNSFL